MAGLVLSAAVTGDYNGRLAAVGGPRAPRHRQSNVTMAAIRARMWEVGLWGLPFLGT